MDADYVIDEHMYRSNSAGRRAKDTYTSVVIIFLILEGLFYIHVGVNLISVRVLDLRSD